MGIWAGSLYTTHLWRLNLLQFSAKPSEKLTVIADYGMHSGLLHCLNLIWISMMHIWAMYLTVILFLADHQVSSVSVITKQPINIFITITTVMSLYSLILYEQKTVILSLLINLLRTLTSEAEVLSSLSYEQSYWYAFWWIDFGFAAWFFLFLLQAQGRWSSSHFCSS